MLLDRSAIDTNTSTAFGHAGAVFLCAVQGLHKRRSEQRRTRSAVFVRPPLPPLAREGMRRLPHSVVILGLGPRTHACCFRRGEAWMIYRPSAQLREPPALDLTLRAEGFDP